MILISGAAGFVGQAVFGRLTRAGHKVVALAHGESFVANADGFRLDLNNPRHYELLLDHCGECRTLIHLAGRVTIELSPGADTDTRPRAPLERFAEIYRSNVVMTARVLEFALTADIRHVLFASSQTVYGLPATAVVTENASLEPLEHYAASKVACETALALWARGHDRKATVLRFPGVWGEGRRHGIVHTLCRQALDDGRVRVGAHYPLPFDVLHCEDVASAFDAAIGRPGNGWRVYNVATGERCSLTRLGRDIAELVPGCRLETCGVPQPDIALDSGRAERELGWRAWRRGERLVQYMSQLRSGDLHRA